jgi:hypothetical protein
MISLTSSIDEEEHQEWSRSILVVLVE